MFLTDVHLRAIMPNAGDRVRVYLEPLQRAIAAYQVDSKLECAAFLATLAEETDELRRMVELMNYSAPRLMVVWPKRFPTLAAAEPYAHNPQRLANYVYANRGGNGDTASNDGWRYRGRSAGITFKNNYLMVGDLMGLDLLKKPELLEQPVHASFAAAAFWWHEKFWDGTERGDFRRVTQRWAGALTNYDDRLIYFNRAKAALGA